MKNQHAWLVVHKRTGETHDTACTRAEARAKRKSISREPDYPRWKGYTEYFDKVIRNPYQIERYTHDDMFSWCLLLDGVSIADSDRHRTAADRDHESLKFSQASGIPIRPRRKK